ncbi:MAG: HAD-IIA family hydrolase [Eggerthellaceae bacterium]|nr:HAD-IIA family hydrolase [Eggerthellaceae bacterium]
MQDVFGRSIDSLRSKKLFIFDMDGTIYTDGKLYGGSSRLMDRIRSRGGHYVFFTNNSSKSVEEYVDRLNAMGIPVSSENFSTSVDATVAYLDENHKGERVYCMGTASLVEGLRNAGLDVTENVTDDASVVLIGFDTELTSEKIRKTCEMLTHDVTYLATNVDLACPTSFGFVPDCGAIAQMIESATKLTPKFLGKPAPFMVEAAMRRFDCAPQETVVVGDRLYTDIAAGVNANACSVCVLTGEATIDDIKASDVSPTYTVSSVADILKVLD